MESPKNINNVFPEAMMTACVCKLCFKKFDDNAHIATVIPKCGHTFCEQCIDRLTDEETQLIACPDCVNTHTYVDMQTMWNQPIDGHATDTCNVHDEQLITEYCKTCREGICKTCADNLHSSGSHNVTNLQDFEERIRCETITKLDRMQVEKERLINVHRSVSSSLETLKSATEADIRAIKDAFCDCRKWLKDYEDKLVSEVISASALPVTELTHVQKELKLKIDTIECHEIEADEAFHSKTPLICAKLCHYLSDSMSEIEQNSEKTLELPEAASYKQYIVRKNLMDSLQTVSMNSTLEFDTKTAPSRCTVHIGPAFVEEKCLISIQATDYMGRMNHSGGDVVRAVLITPDQTSAEATVSDMDNGCYKVIFKPTCDGEYILHLYVFEEELPDSPYTISTTKIDMVSRSQAWVGGRCKVNIKASSTGSNYLTLKDISAKILTPDGEYADLKVDGSKNSFNVTFYTKKQGRHRIILSVHGQKIEKPFDISIADHLQIGGEGSHLTGSSSFSDLVMVTETGELLVADTEENKRLQRFSLHGKHLGDIEIPGIDTGPTRIAYDSFLKRIVLLFYESGFLQILLMNGQLMKRFKVRRKGSSDPRGLATCSRGRIYVSDYLNHVVYTFKGSDNDCGTPYPGSDVLMATIGGEGTLPGKFKHPLDVRIDIRDTLYVLDSGNNRIQHLDKAGRSLHTIMLDRHARWVSITVPLDGTVMTRGYTRPGSGMSAGQQIVRLPIDVRKDAIKQPVSAHLPIDAPLNFVSGIALTHEGCVYLLDHLSICIRKYRYDWTSVFQK
ncbi:tripartite motif-containing protein 2-like [Anneissia japonica]|uniref:tripartite motif-containing protein 2-like n=1 Tax=Anneissia japonica TaxID=1529436 RepID=UPI001425A908|nr:tripartite motif-containing protein 2-like [Anneissia japonica]XP_033107260.1 tripartite motif-containing protein 2-like [Anneissia japonica]XP_033107261.1 tripartite motif-containing protein 2-like [Anneissia japonica]XP_033107262.1 tripartite motif-containing protein 2-like [Anneissia japonica]